MTAMRNLVVHVNDEVVSSHAVDLAVALAAQWSARLTAVVVEAPVNAGVGLSAETASLARQLVQAQRAALLEPADFIVMGGYGHSRLWELVLGGVTRTMLDTMTVPVLMSH